MHVTLKHLQITVQVLKHLFWMLHITYNDISIIFIWLHVLTEFLEFSPGSGQGARLLSSRITLNWQQ